MIQSSRPVGVRDGADGRSAGRQRKAPRKGQQTAKGSARKHMRAKVEEAVDMAEPHAVVDVPPERDTSEPFASADNDSSDSAGELSKRHDMTEEYDEWVEAIHTAADTFEKDLIRAEESAEDL